MANMDMENVSISTSSYFLDQRTVGRRKRKDVELACDGQVMFYYYPDSYYCQQVLMALCEKDIGFESQLIDVKLGEQFSEEFLQLNPKGEVPVLVHGLVTLVDSAKIIAYLDENFNHTGDVPRLFPKNDHQRQRVESYYRRVSELNVTVLTLGSVIFPELELQPHGIFKNESNRFLMKEYIQHRRAIYRTQAYNFQEHSPTLTDKADDAQQDWPYLTDRKYYESLILTFEKLLNEVDRELRGRNDPTNIEHTWWLCSPSVSAADIGFGLLLHRMWELGYSARLIDCRPQVSAYYKRFQKLKSFRKTVFLEVEGENFVRVLNISFIFLALGTVLFFYLKAPGDNGLPQRS